MRNQHTWLTIRKFFPHLLTGCCFALLVSSSGLSPAVAAERVHAERGEQSVAIFIDDAVFTTFRFAQGEKKPHFDFVSAPDGLNKLKSALTDDQAALGKLVIVATEQAELKTESGPKTIPLGTVLAVSAVHEDGQLAVQWKENNGSLSSRNVVPLASMVTRVVQQPDQQAELLPAGRYDHPHHKGIWVSVDEVNDVKFWAEEGLIINQSVELVHDANPVVLKIVNHWLDKDEKPLLEETSTVTIDHQRLIVYDIELKAIADQVSFGDTKEGFLGIRFADVMREDHSKGRVINAEGLKGANSAWGKTSRWLDYCGKIEGNTFGVTIMDDPANPWPSRHHVRGYGLFSVSPFGDHSYTERRPDRQPAREIQLNHGESLSFRYALWVHADAVDVSQIESVSSTAFTHESAESTETIHVKVTGILKTGLFAIGAETTGTTITANGVTWELDFQNHDELRTLADELDQQLVTVSGTLERRAGVEIPQRWIVTVDSLIPADHSN